MLVEIEATGLGAAIINESLDVMKCSEGIPMVATL